MDDDVLLRDYIEHRCEAAFAELVSRHVNLVYSTALRLVGEPQSAQDVVQTVFIGLARKPQAVHEPGALAGWLYRATCFAAAGTLRTEQRRRLRENDAMQMNLSDTNPDTVWQSLAPHVEEAMATLDAADQNAVVLRFFQGRSLREVGMALGLSDDAAQKRVSRALDKLRQHFSNRGIGTSTALLGTILTGNAVHVAPGGLASSVTAASLAEVTSWTTILKTMFSVTKTKVAIVATIGIVAAVSVPIFVSQRNPARGFGPVHEVFLDNSGNATFLDLDTGRVLPDYTGNRADFEDWIKDSGVDIALPRLVTARNGSTSFVLNGADVALPEHAAPKDGICSFAMRYGRFHNSSWNQLSAAEILRNLPAMESEPVSPTRDFVLCGTYVFETREGGIGIAQITLYTAYPRDMRVRYKLALR